MADMIRPPAGGLKSMAGRREAWVRREDFRSNRILEQPDRLRAYVA